MTDPLDRLTTALSDRYRIKRELGQGGMATVYLAEDLKHGRKVAIKVLRPELAAIIGAERFLREIKTIASLQHPHILGLIDSGELDGTAFYVMPFVEGESLRERLHRDKQLPIADAVRIATEVAAALDYAHRHGVIHRDIKPENILLHDGNAMVADFGIALAVDTAGGQRLTETGMSLGTPSYMSPEQAMGERTITARSDLYALGVVTYEMLVGEPPFTGPTAQSILAKALTEPSPLLRVLRPTVPAAVEAAVLAALQKLPADRWGSALEFAKAMEGSGKAAAPDASTPSSRPPRVLPAVGLGVVLITGAVLAWNQMRRNDAGANIRRLAVLPFENLGDSSNAYFVDGVTDAIRGKLIALPGFQLTDRSSSNQYRHTAKTPQQIGQELGVQYLLTGTVRWAGQAGQTDRVRVNPELIDVSNAVAKWQQPFDAPMADVFQVQAEIADRVAQALGLALADSTKQRLTRKPTSSLAAYDAFLRGEEVSQGLGADLVPLRRAVAYYEQATALDSTFGLAWSHLSRALTRMQSLGAVYSDAEDRAAFAAAERAIALDPASADGHMALGDYYAVFARDKGRALQEYTEALRRSPRDAALHTRIAVMERRSGQWDDALAHLRQAQALDPRSLGTVRSLSGLLLLLRRYPEALDACDRFETLAPGSLGLVRCRVWAFVGMGDLEGARSVLSSVTIDPGELAVAIAINGDMPWVLQEPAQLLLLYQQPGAFDNDRGTWGLTLAQTYWDRGDRIRARVYADSARLAILEQLRTQPQDPMRQVFLGVSLAYLGQQDAAVAEWERGVAMVSSVDRVEATAYFEEQLVRIYLLGGKLEQALGRLEPLLDAPGPLSPGRLRIDPMFRPLVGNPRFERLAMRTK